MSYQKILVPLDGSELAESALPPLVEVASPGAVIHLLSVVGAILIEPPVGEGAALTTNMNPAFALTGVPTPPMMQRISDPQTYHERLNYLQTIGDWLRGKGYRVTADVQPGGVVETIVNLAQDGYDLVVMATHGRTGLRKMVLGSVAEAVLHKAPCPVLLIPAQPTNPIMD